MASDLQLCAHAALEGAVRGGGTMAAFRGGISLLGATFTGRLFKKPGQSLKELLTPDGGWRVQERERREEGCKNNSREEREREREDRGKFVHAIF